MLLSKPPEGSNFWHQTEGFKNVYDLERIKILELFCSLWLKIMLKYVILNAVVFNPVVVSPGSLKFSMMSG